MDSRISLRLTDSERRFWKTVLFEQSKSDYGDGREPLTPTPTVAQSSCMFRRTSGRNRPQRLQRAWGVVAVAMFDIDVQLR
jgi:hypothetical protein